MELEVNSPQILISYKNLLKAFFLFSSHMISPQNDTASHLLWKSSTASCFPKFLTPFLSIPLDVSSFFACLQSFWNPQSSGLLKFLADNWKVWSITSANNHQIAIFHHSGLKYICNAVHWTVFITWANNRPLTFYYILL